MSDTPTPAQADEKARELFVRIRDCWDEDECPSFSVVEPLLDQLIRLAALRPEGDAVAWAWARRWAYDEVDVTAMKKADRPPGWQFHDVTRRKIIADDVPLYAIPPVPAQVEAASLPAPGGVEAVLAQHFNVDRCFFTEEEWIAGEVALRAALATDASPSGESQS